MICLQQLRQCRRSFCLCHNERVYCRNDDDSEAGATDDRTASLRPTCACSAGEAYRYQSHGDIKERQRIHHLLVVGLLDRLLSVLFRVEICRPRPNLRKSTLCMPTTCGLGVIKWHRNCGYYTRTSSICHICTLKTLTAHRCTLVCTNDARLYVRHSNMMTRGWNVDRTRASYLNVARTIICLEMKAVKLCTSNCCHTRRFIQTSANA